MKRVLCLEDVILKSNWKHSINYLDAAKFVPDYSNEDKAICYGVTGGVAKYLSMIDSKKSIDENIISLLLNRLHLEKMPFILLQQKSGKSLHFYETCVIVCSKQFFTMI